MPAYPINNCAEVLEDILETVQTADPDEAEDWEVHDAHDSGWLTQEGEQAVLRFGRKEYLVTLKEVAG